MRGAARLTILACAAVVALSGCADVTGAGADAPDPVKTLPAPIASLVRTDVGEYFVTPRPGTSDKDVQATIEKLRGMPGVQSVELLKDGRVDLQFSGGSTPDQHEAAVKQLAALGDPVEGV